MNQTQIQAIRDDLNLRLANLVNSIGATDDEVRIALLVCEIDGLKELLQAYRNKRSVDGYNGRTWDALKHYDMEELIDSLESKRLK